MNIFDLQATISLDASGFESGLSSASQSFQNFGQTIQSTAIGNLAASAVKAAGKAVVGFGQDVVETGQSFESGMSQVAATLGMTMDDVKSNVNGAGDTFAALKATAAEMGRETVFSATEAAEGLNILAMSGFSAEKAMEMLPDVLNLAAAGSMSMADAAAYISGSMKGFADETKASQYYTDLMAKGATLANTSVQQLGEAMSAGAAGAAAYSQSADSMTIALLRLAEQGEVGSAAGTALAAAMKNIYTPTDQAALALDELGIAAYDSSGKARDFNDIVNELNAALSGMTDAEANAYKQTIFGIQGLNAFNKMTVTGIAKQNQWADALAGASDGIGEAAKQYATMTDNLEGAKAGLDSALDGMKNAIYEKLRDPLKNAANTAASAINQITAGFESDGIRGALAGLGSFIKEKITDIWKNIELPPALKTIADTFTGAFNKIRGVVESFEIGDKFGAAFDKIKEVAGEFDFDGIFGGIKEKITDAFLGIKEKLGGIDFEGIFGNVKEKLSGAFNIADSVFEGIKISIYEKIPAIKEKLTGAFDSIKETIQNLDLAEKFSGLKEKLTGAFEGLKETVDNLDIGEKLSGIKDKITEAFDNVKETIDKLNIGEKLSGLKDKIVEAFNGVKEKIDGIDFEAVFGGIKDGILGAFNKVKDTVGGIDFKEIFGNVKDKIGEAIDAVKEPITEKVELIKGVFDDIKRIFADIKDGFGDFDTSIFERIGESIERFAEKFSGFKSIKFDVITQGIHDFAAAFDDENVGSRIAGTAENILKLSDAFLTASADIIETVTEKIGDFLDGFKNSSALSSIGKLADDIGKLFDKFLEVSADTITEVAGATKRFMEAFNATEIGEKFGDFVGSVAKLFDTIATVSADSLEDTGKALKEFIKSTNVESTGAGFSAFVGAILDLSSASLDSIAAGIERITGAFSGLGESIGRTWAEHGPDIGNLMDKLSEFLDFCTETGQEIADAFAPVQEVFDQIFGATVQLGLEAVIGFLGGIEETLSSIIGMITGDLKICIDLIKLDFPQAWEDAKQGMNDFAAFIEGIGQTILGPLEAVVEDAKRIGSDIINGIFEGISDAWKSVKEGIGDIADKITGFFRDKWDEHSPSRVFRRIGAYGMEGLRLGWMDEYAQFKRELERENVEISAMTKTSFENSAIGKSSAAGVSSLGLLADNASAEPVEVNLILDGDVAASALYDPIQRVAFQRGTSASTHGREVVAYA